MKSQFALALCCAVLFTGSALAQKSKQNPNPQDCSKVPDYAKLKKALTDVVKQGKDANGGLGNQEWGTVVNRDGMVCAVVFTGPNRGAEWPGSRVISAEKANTANAFSTDNFALSTGNVYSAAQPGQSLYGIITPANPNVAFAGNPQDFGQQNDPMVGKPIGGVIVFGGGLALYTNKGELVGGLGVSGDTACADHVVAWKTRHALGLDAVPMGVAPGPSDNLIFDIKNGVSTSGFGHPDCKGGKPNEDIIQKLNQTLPVGPKK
ncbi:MAG TPA: heme-binding protein [Terriglobales bacterium]|nr:heme-binding protein [Terriglobales bacterium]